jgi:hypothetical protein
MKANIKKMFFGILTIMLIFPLTSCAQKINFLTSSVIPAARGYVLINKDKNSNFDIKIRISYLAGVERLQDSKQTYIVWMLTNQEITKNIGRLNSSNKLKASFKTVSSFKPIKIFITAEQNENILYPEGPVVLSTERF